MDRDVIKSLYNLFIRDGLKLIIKNGIKYTYINNEYCFKLNAEKWPGDRIYAKYGIFKESE